MPRRKPYTKLLRNNETKANHVTGKGDVVFKGFQCLNTACEQIIFVPAADVNETFEVACPSCSSVIGAGDETKLFDYELKNNSNTIEKGPFTVFHDDYLAEAQAFKYCVLCKTLKPLIFFDQHSSRRSKKQGECKLCKKTYNNIKNQTRLTDQHREAAQKRRLYMDIAGGKKIDSQKVFNRFQNQCFKCGKDLSAETDPKERPLDHTFPAYYLWPLTTETATLLCRTHNGEKAERWPSAYYLPEKLKRLSVLTGIEFELLSGPSVYNPSAIAHLKKKGVVDSLLNKYAAYMEEIIKLRNRLLRHLGFDIFKYSVNISQTWIETADILLEKTAGPGFTKEPDTDEK